MAFMQNLKKIDKKGDLKPPIFSLHKAYYVNFRYLSDKTKKRGSWSSFLILIIYCCGSTVGAGNGGDIGCTDGSPPAIRDNGNH